MERRLTDKPEAYRTFLSSSIVGIVQISNDKWL